VYALILQEDSEDGKQS